MKKIDINYIKSELQKINNYFLRGDYLKVIEKTKILLKKDPHQVPFYNYIGLSYKQLKKYDLAIEIFKKGLNIFPKSITILSNLGAVYRNKDEFLEAEKYFNIALSINPNDTNVLINFANLKRDQNKINESIEFYERAHKINNNIEVLLVNLAGAYQIIGEFEKSKKIIKEIQEKYPKNIIADKIYSVIHKYKDNDEHQSLMLTKVKDVTLNQQDKSKLYFALAKSYSDQNNIEESVKYINLGNKETFNSFKNYNFKNEIKRFDKNKQIFENYTFSENPKSEIPNLIFIVGLPRSGTTLTHQIISSHSKVFGAGELSILSNFLSDRLFDEKFIDLFFNNEFNKFEFINKTSDYLFNLFKENDKEKIILDKSPLNFEWIGFIKIMFPNAKIIHCKRNLQDVALSIYKNTFDGSSLPWSYEQDNLVEFIKLYKDLMSFWNKKLPNYIYECEYENLVNNPDNEIPKLIEFCNLSWEENCLNFTKNKTAIKTVSIAQARQPIYKSSVDLFKDYKKYLNFLDKI